jgi:hypothetical protein
MKTFTSKLYLVSAKASTAIKMALFIATLVMFVLAAGAPQAGGSIGG